MLAHDFIASQAGNFEIIALGRDLCDIADPVTIRHALQNHCPDVVLNCAAYTAVDDAEDAGALMNYSVNTLGSYYLAKECAANGIDFITISTDYVFDGAKQIGYLPDDEPNPINAYGMAKYLGEKLVRSTHPDSIIIRTSWLYGGGAEFKNFVNTMLRLAAIKNELSVVSDQFGAPTSARDLSLAISCVLRNIPAYRKRTLHFCNEAEEIRGISWFDFACEIIRISGSSTRVLPISASSYPTRAMRPQESHMINDSDIRLPNWKLSLAHYVLSVRNLES